MPIFARPAGRAKAFGLATGGVNNVQFEGMPVNVPLNCHEVNVDGMLGGDPLLATAQKGERIVQHLVGFCSRFVDHMRTFDMRAPCLKPNGEMRIYGDYFKLV